MNIHYLIAKKSNSGKTAITHLFRFVCGVKCAFKISKHTQDEYLTTEKIPFKMPNF